MQWETASGGDDYGNDEISRVIYTYVNKGNDLTEIRESNSCVKPCTGDL